VPQYRHSHGYKPNRGHIFLRRKPSRWIRRKPSRPHFGHFIVTASVSSVYRIRFPYRNFLECQTHAAPATLNVSGCGKRAEVAL
jgi:hypothetical protein